MPCIFSLRNIGYCFKIQLTKVSPDFCLFRVSKDKVKGAEGLSKKPGMIITNKVNWDEKNDRIKCSQPRFLEILDLWEWWMALQIAKDLYNLSWISLMTHEPEMLLVCKPIQCLNIFIVLEICHMLLYLEIDFIKLSLVFYSNK